MCEGAVPWCENGDLLGVAEKFCMLCFEGVTLGFFSFMGICAALAFVVTHTNCFSSKTLCFASTVFSTST